MIDKKEFLKELDELAIPIDFEALIADGVLEQKTKKKYKLLKPDALPKHAWKKVTTISDTKGKTIVLEFTDYTKFVKNLREKMK